MKKMLIVVLLSVLPVSVFAQGLPLKDGNTGTLADVETCGSFNCLQTTLPSTPAAGGYVKLADKDGHQNNFTQEFRQSIGVDNLQFQEVVDGAVVNINNWNPASVTFTQAITNGFLVLNSAASIGINASSIVTSNKAIPLYSQFGNHISWVLKTPNIPQANAVMEVGLGFVATTSAPTGSGAYFRWNSDATFKACVLWSGTEVCSGTLTNPSINVVHVFDIFIGHTNVQFFVDDVLAATVVPGGNAVPMVPAHIPLFARTYTLGVAPSIAPQLFVSLVQAIQKDLANYKLWTDSIAGMDHGSYVSPVTAYLQTANHANSTSPTSATLSNTAASYTTLGGRWQLAAVAGAVTDFALFGYQVPTGFTLHVTDIRITTANTGAAVGATGTVFDWSAAVQSSGVSLATADAVGPPMTWSPRRLPLCVQGLPSAAAIGAMTNDCTVNFTTPLVVNSGRFFHIILQMPVGLATASEIYRGDVMIDGYFE